MDFTVLECKHFVAPSSKRVIKRTVYDYEFDFHVKGGRTIFVDEDECIIKSGDISVRKPGQVVYSFGDYDCYILTLDFTGKKHPEGYSRNAQSNVGYLCDDMSLSFLPNVIASKKTSEYVEIFSEISLESDLNSDFSKKNVRKLLYMMNIDALSDNDGKESENMHPVYIAYRFINNNYREKITLKSIAESVHMDPSYLSRVFKKRFGFAPMDFVIRLRMDYALSLLSDTDMTVAEISHFCGYNNISFFVSEFKKRFGYPPGKYRLKLSEKVNNGNNT